MRKQLLSSISKADNAASDTLDIPEIAKVLVTSEHPDHPVENAFDGQTGPGANRWIAESGGEQTICLAFDVPQKVQAVEIEIEEREESRVQEIQLSVSRDNGKKYDELIRQEFNFSPTGATFERENWNLNLEGVTHLLLRIRPDKGGRHGKATLTSFRVR